MKIQVITLFPEMFTGVVGASMLWKAADRNIVQYEFKYRKKVKKTRIPNR